MLKNKLQRYFITGTIVLLPVFLTAYFLFYGIRFLDNILGRFINHYLQQYFGITVFGLGILAMLVLILSAGILATNMLIRRVLPFIENWFLHIPFVQQVYPSFKQLIKFLFSEGKMSFKKVVIFEYPRKDIYTIGFVTNEIPILLPDGTKIDAACVFIASAPNPITGFSIIVPKKDMMVLDISIEEAFKIIISGGVITPGELKTTGLLSANSDNKAEPGR